MARDWPGMNDSLPHGSESARRTHLARGEPLCSECAAVVGVLELEAGWLPDGIRDLGEGASADSGGQRTPSAPHPGHPTIEGEEVDRGT